MEEEEKGTGGGVALGKTKSARHKEKREDDREQATQAGFGNAIKKFSLRYSKLIYRRFWEGAT